MLRPIMSFCCPCLSRYESDTSINSESTSVQESDSDGEDRSCFDYFTGGTKENISAQDEFVKGLLSGGSDSDDERGTINGGYTRDNQIPPTKYISSDL